MPVRDWGEAFLTAIADAFRKIFTFLPDLIGALIILWVGWFIAGLLAKLVTNVLRKVNFNQATEKAGLNRFVAASGVRKDPSEIMGELVKWFFRIIALLAAFSVLQLPALTVALTGILNFIPRLIVAVVILMVGGLLAGFVGNFVRGAAGSAGFSNGSLVANIARGAILYVAIVAALGQLGVAETVINTLFIGTIAALALALGLAFGLGGRDTASRIWENAYNSAQENLPKLGDGVRRQAEQTKQQANQAVNQAAQQNTPHFQPTQQGYAMPQSYAAQPAQPAQPAYERDRTQQMPTTPRYTPQPDNSSQPQSGGYYDGGQQPGGYYTQGSNSQGQSYQPNPSPNYPTNPSQNYPGGSSQNYPPRQD